MQKALNLNLASPTEVRMTINGDSGRVLVFDPADVAFVNRFYEAYQQGEQRLEHYRALDAEIDAMPAEPDERGMSPRALRRLETQRELCADLRAMLDKVFGAGTCKMVFGDADVPGQFVQLIEAVTPHLVAARAGKLGGKQKGGAAQ